MMRTSGQLLLLLTLAGVVGLLLASSASVAGETRIVINWADTIIKSRTETTYQVVVNPMIRRGSPIHDATFAAIKDLGADMVRFVPWLPYPRLGVAELQPPNGNPICAVAPGQENVFLGCPNGVFSSIDFASYGTPTGFCRSFKKSSCNAASSLAAVQKLCLGKASCVVPVDPATFGGDPCYGTVKHLSVQATCTGTRNTTSWDFNLIDPMMEDLMNATSGHSTIINFSTIPEWMFITSYNVTYPDDPNQVFWSYEQGTTLRDPSLREVGDYYKRLVSWYTKGGFTDEFGVMRKSGHYYDIPYWEVLNEVDAEHSMSPEYYTKVYDAIVTSIREVQPNMKFVGMALAGHPEYNWFQYFLNHSNHQAGIPLDWISYHFYAGASSRTDPATYAAFFPQADGFLLEVKYREQIRKVLSPNTKTDLDELGVILPNDNDPNPAPIPDIYWNAAGSMYAYLVFNLALQGIDRVGESQLVGYPTQYPSVSLIDWKTGKPNARYWVLSLLHRYFGIGDELVSTVTEDPINLFAQAYVTASGARRVAIINKTLQPIVATLPGAAQRRLSYVDLSTGYNPPKTITLTSDTFTVTPFAVFLVQLD
eukprot:TRINITY_DN3114_c0_g1_i1.p1 TRINITY_DN3114_c0_g1~~TRINITY_DN3114_c0_g1_i1.p1  ORF type:complete len:594 (-),score=87.16 TRINITY_DN3114_c0_g1_i1:102-1883(-)